jgi:hypothetical protein
MKQGTISRVCLLTAALVSSSINYAALDTSQQQRVKLSESMSVMDSPEACSFFDEAGFTALLEHDPKITITSSPDALTVYHCELTPDATDSDKVKQCETDGSISTHTPTEPLVATGCSEEHDKEWTNGICFQLADGNNLTIQVAPKKIAQQQPSFR